MKKQTKTLLIKYGCSIGICLALSLWRIFSQDVLALELQEQYRVIGDSFFLHGFLCFASGLMLWLSQEGAFDGIGYVLSYAWHAILPGSLNKRESYKDYLARQREKDRIGFGFLIITGLLFILVSTVFTILFHL